MSPQGGSSPNGHHSNGHSAASKAGNGHDKRSSVPVNWERLARATAHPLRVSILEILGIDGGRVLSPSDLSRELQIPLSNTNYHVTELAKAGLIELHPLGELAPHLLELVRERQVRGATEHFYRLPGTGEAEGGAEPRAEDSERAWAMA